MLLQQLPSPPPLPVLPLNRLPITYGLLGSPCLKPTSTWSPTSGMNTKPRLADTLPPPFVGEQALAQPFGAVLEVPDVPRARGVEVQQELEAVVVVDGLVKFERLERVQPLAVDADGDVVVQCQHVVIAFRLWGWVLRMRRSAAAQVRG